MRLEDLTAEAFAPFGTVLDPERVERRPINNGTCTRFHALADVPVFGEGARVVVNLFRAEPIARPFALAMMERHPLGAQAFWPLSDRPWLVAVAPDEGGRPGPPRLFRPGRGVGVAYRRGVWHHPLVVLQASDHLVIDREGPGANLEEAAYARPWPLPDDAYDGWR